MPVNEKYVTLFEFDSIYHIYSRTNNKELLFRNHDNYYHFLNLYARYINPFLLTYAWTLLPNHFHFLVRVKDIVQIKTYLTNIPLEKRTKSEREFLVTENIDMLIERQFTRFFTSYAMSYNNEHKRKGNLFYRTFRRVKINNEEHFTKACVYIHANAQKHKIVDNFSKYKWTSYHSILSNLPTLLERKYVIDLFGGKERFIQVNRKIANEYYREIGILSLLDED